MGRFSIVPARAPEPRAPSVIGEHPVMTAGRAYFNLAPHAFCYRLRDDWAGLPPGVYVRCGRSVWLVPGTYAGD